MDVPVLLLIGLLVTIQLGWLVYLNDLKKNHKEFVQQVLNASRKKFD
ncbi:hypothetical protein SAMN05421743_108173 [Thalassobacillus cyri]|uniref:Uncharacterized protein n=1 Tax=Thalassobacillus cyri TaxID=571932 RepID=A0A1H4E7H8_9BACI|nr:hypothetical protein [Thalassobacillus cyri]SEA81034.1 hypothetical protein SAMN05421743_108173 [Thalassobacillus cyri]